MTDQPIYFIDSPYFHPRVRVTADQLREYERQFLIDHLPVMEHVTYEQMCLIDPSFRNRRHGVITPRRDLKEEAN